MKFPFLKIKNKKESNEAEVFVYGDITDDKWVNSDVTPAEFAELSDLDADVITVYINSFGGSAFAGFTIANILKRHKAMVVTVVDGIAASSAANIFMAGDVRVMNSNTMLYVHNAVSSAYGYASDMRKAAVELDKISSLVNTMYQEATGLKPAKLKEIMDAESSMIPDEALRLGFATGVNKNKKASISKSDNSLVVNGLQIDITKNKFIKPENFNCCVPAQNEVNMGLIEMQLLENQININKELINELG